MTFRDERTVGDAGIVRDERIVREERIDRGSRNETALRDQLNALTPRLRRYARALASSNAAPSEFADELVHTTLMRALGARQIGAASDLIIRLYATVTQLNREVAVSGLETRAAGAGRPTLIVAGPNFAAARNTKLSAALAGLPLEAREALLLVGLEGFDYAAAARILRVSRAVLMTRLTQARTALDVALQSRPSVQDLGREGRGRAPHLRLVT